MSGKPGPEDARRCVFVNEAGERCQRYRARASTRQLCWKHDEDLMASHERRCTRIKQDGERCSNIADEGSIVCRYHGGNSPSVKKAAARRQLSKYVTSAFMVPNPVPVTDPLQALSMLASEVMAWREGLRRMVIDLGDDLTKVDAMQVERVRGLVELYERSIDRADKVLTNIAKLNLDERLVKITELQVTKVVEALDRTFDELNLSESQRVQARERLTHHLRAA